MLIEQEGAPIHAISRALEEGTVKLGRSFAALFMLAMFFTARGTQTRGEQRRVDAQRGSKVGIGTVGDLPPGEQGQAAKADHDQAEISGQQPAS